MVTHFLNAAHAAITNYAISQNLKSSKKYVTLNSDTKELSEGWKHKAAKERIKFELSLYFNVVQEEFLMPVPNPQRIFGDLNAVSTRKYVLDVFAEDPIWRKIESLKYPRIGIEIDGDVGHRRTKRQYKRDIARTKQLCEYKVYEGLLIVRFDSEYLAGKGFRDPRNNFIHRPKLTPAEILKEIGLVPRKIAA